ISLACPFFVPTQRWEAGAWQHPSRLPLGAGWRGSCSAPGCDGSEPSEEHQRELCNLGYATGWSRVPGDRSFDAVRFAISRDDGSRLQVCFVCEIAHRPAAHGSLEYDAASGRWLTSHSDPRLQRQADCYVQSYLSRSVRPAVSKGACEPTHA